MTRPAVFRPTPVWYAAVLAALAVLTGGGLLALKLGTGRLQDPYRPKQPAPQTTPWLHNR